jgi:hypothetical protein
MFLFLLKFRYQLTGDPKNKSPHNAEQKNMLINDIVFRPVRLKMGGTQYITASISHEVAAFSQHKYRAHSKLTKMILKVQMCFEIFLSVTTPI